MCQQQICPSNATYVTHANYFMCRHKTTMSVYKPHMSSLQWTMIPGALIRIHFTWLAYAPEKHMCATLHIYVTLHFYCSLHIDTTLLHISIKIIKLQHLFTKLLQIVCQKQTCPTNATNIAYVTITQCVFIGRKYSNIYVTFEVTSTKWCR